MWDVGGGRKEAKRGAAKRAGRGVGVRRVFLKAYRQKKYDQM
jgi:hypothetical protein